jgi:glycerophosphoryl diester phosphodiesterase
VQAEWLTRSPIAHRGLWDTAECPENSLAAFKQAVAHGIPFELDVQLTRDGQLAVVHDTDLERLTGKPHAVADLDMADLHRLRIDGTGERIPSLGEVLEIAEGVPFVVDVRQWHGSRNGDLERAVLDAVRGYGGPFALQSFDPLAVLRMRRGAGGHPVGQAAGNLRSAGQLARILGRPMLTNAVTRPSYISYELSALPSSWVRFWQRLGIPVLAWTVTSAAMEEDATSVADNFFFDEYLPRAYASELN